NNTSSDTDTPAPVADLAVTKSDSVATYTAGNSTTYTIVVSNSGPSNVLGASLVDTLPGGSTASGTSWTFVSASGGASVAGASSGSGALSTTVNLPSGSSLTFTQ